MFLQSKIEPNPLFKRILSGSFFLFGMAMTVSMAGLEIFGNILILLAIIFWFQERPNLLFLKKYLVLSLAMAMIVTLSLILNSHWDVIGFQLGWYRWILLPASLATLLRYQNSQIHTLRVGIYGGVILSSLYSIVQFFTGYDFIRHKEVVYFADLNKEITRVTGFFNMPTTYGYILALFLLIPVTRLFSQGLKKQTTLDLIAFCLGLLTLGLTFTRGAWIALFAGAMLLISRGYPKYFWRTVGATTLAGFVAFFTSTGFYERITSIFDPAYYSNSQRIELWSAYIEIFINHPWFGVGLNQAEALLPYYHELLEHNENIISHAHNEYLQYLAGSGLFGFLSFLIFLFYLNRTSLQIIPSTPNLSNHPEEIPSLALHGAVVCFLFCLFFDCNFGDSEVRYSLLTYTAIILSQLKGVSKPKHFSS